MFVVSLHPKPIYTNSYTNRDVCHVFIDSDMISIINII